MFVGFNFYTMRCPKCGNIDDRVIDSRLSREGASIRRRRECIHCNHRFTTYEEIELADLRVIKRDGRHEVFDRQKLFAGMLKACEKRPISVEQLELVSKDIVRDLEKEYTREIPSRAIGARVMERLHDLDEVAYVRYASVYRQFQDIGEFINEIQSLEKRMRSDADQTELFQY